MSRDGRLGIEAMTWTVIGDMLKPEDGCSSSSSFSRWEFGRVGSLWDEGNWSGLFGSCSTEAAIRY